MRTITNQNTIAASTVTADLITTTELDATSIGSNLIPTVDANYNIGSSAKQWLDCYLANNITCNQIFCTGASRQFVAGTTGTLTQFNCPAPASNITITFPTTTDTMVGRATTDTLTNKTFSGGTFSGSIGGTSTITCSTVNNANIVCTTSQLNTGTTQLQGNLSIESTIARAAYYADIATSGAQSISSATLTHLTSWNVTTNYNSLFSTSTKKFTMPVTGKWRWTIWGGFAASTTALDSIAVLALTDDSSNVLIQHKREFPLSASSISHELAFSRVLTHTANDVVKIQVYHNMTAGSINFGLNTDSTLICRCHVELVST